SSIASGIRARSARRRGWSSGRLCLIRPGILLAPSRIETLVMRPLRSGAALCWIAALAAVVRIAFVAIVPFKQVCDNALYLEFAERIASGQGYTLDGHPTAFWSAGYPLTVGGLFCVTGASAAAAIALNIVGAVVMVVLLAKIAQKVTGDRAVANLAAL